MTFDELIEKSRRVVGGYYLDGKGRIGIASSVGLWGAAIAWYSWTSTYGYQLTGSAETSKGATFHKPH